MKQVREVRSIDTVTCGTDGYLTIDKEIYLISLFGSQTRVNTVRAIILKGETVYLQDLWTWKNATPVKRADKKLKTVNRQLAPGVAHCLVYAPNYLEAKEPSEEKIFFGDSDEQLMEKFFQAAQMRYTTPFLPEWRDWLYGQMGKIPNINAMGFNQVLGVKFHDEADLEARLFEAGAPLSGGGYAIPDEKEEIKQSLPAIEDAVAAEAVADGSTEADGYKRLIDLN